MIAFDPQEEQAFGQCGLERQRLAEEIHAEEPDDERHRHEHHGDDRQRLHDVVGAVGDDREVSLQRARDQVAQALGDIVNPHHVIVEIAKIHAMLGLDRLVGIAGQPVQDLALGREDLVELDGRALDPEDRSSGFWASRFR